MFEYLVQQQRYCFFLEMDGKWLLKMCKTAKNSLDFACSWEAFSFCVFTNSL